jgi:hypothetical protein
MSTDKHDEQFSSPIDFPCEFMIKVMGKTDSDFEANVLTIVKKHFPKIRADEFRNRPSKDNNYTAISVTVHAKSKEQLDALYQDLTNEPTILMAL